MNHRSAFVSFVLLLLALALCLVPAGAEDSYEAGTMRLLRYGGSVEILDPAGAPRFVLENVRFASGESLRTGEDGSASVGLDDSKIVTLDAATRVQFVQEDSHIRLNLAEGALFLDVQKGLDENEGLDIQTTTMTVGIRGTIVFVSAGTGEGGAARSALGVLEGTAEVSYSDADGARRLMPVPAGNRIELAAAGDAAAAPVVTPLTAEDIAGFVAETVLADPELARRVEQGSPQGPALLTGAPVEQDPAAPAENPWPADGDWFWDSTVTLVAQSASKLYDGAPLMRPSGVLVSGLPADFSIQVSAAGSLTDAGSAANNIAAWHIVNAAGEDVTSHFTDVRTISGSLVVDPAPLVVWTGSAEKVYDGMPLTCEEAELRTVPGHVSDEPAWLNTSVVTETALGSERMIAVSGRMYVHGTNPLTGESRQFELKAGQSLTVCLHSEGGEQSIEFRIEDLMEDDLPQEVLRLYADNPAMLASACAETGWDPAAVARLIAELPASDAPVAQKNGLAVSADTKDRVIADSADVRIQVDSEITNYNTRALSGDEAHFTPILLDPSVVVTATGSQTYVGESLNTYEIRWGNANPSNYVLSEDLGTLTVLEPPAPTSISTPVTLTAGSAEKVYDGAPLTAPEVTASGLPDGYTFSAASSGSQTAVGAGENKVASWTIRDADGRDVSDLFTNVRTVSGRLTVTALQLRADFGSVSAAYSGQAPALRPTLAYLNGPHAGETVYGSSSGGLSLPLEASGSVFHFTLFTGDTVTLSVSGLEAGAGTHTLSGSVTSGAENFSVSFSGMRYTVAPAALTVATGSAEKVFDGEPLTSEEVTLTGLVDGDAVTAAATGTLTDAGEAENTVSIDWGSVSPDNYTVTETLGTLKVTPLPVTIQLECYDGTAPIVPEAMDALVNGAALDPDASDVVYTDGRLSALTADFTLPGGTVRVTCPAILDAGTSDFRPSAACTSGNTANYAFSYTGTTVTVSPMALEFSLASRSVEYDGKAHAADLAVYCDDESFSTRMMDETGARWQAFDSRGNVIDVTVTGGGTDVGTYPLDCAWSFASGNASNFTITKVETTLEITPRAVAVTVTGHTGSKSYNAEIQRVEGYDLSAGDPLYAVSSVAFSGEAVAEGTNAGTYLMGLGAGQFTNTDPNFEATFTVTDGSLTVTPAELILTTASEEKKYDGYPLPESTDNPPTVSGLFGSDGDHLMIESTGFQVDAGSSTNTAAVLWDDETVGKNYKVTENFGTFTVYKRYVTLTSASDNKVWDGEDLTATVVDVTGDGFASGEDPAFSVTGVQRAVGSSKNTFTYTFASDTNPANYEITEVEGTLTVSTLNVSINLGGRTVPFTGERQSFNTDGVFGTVLNGDSAGAPVLCSPDGEDDSSVTYYFNLGDTEYRLVVSGAGIEPDTYTITHDLTVESGDSSMYNITFENDKLVITE